MSKQMPTTAMTTSRTHQAYGKVHRCINNDPKFGSMNFYNRVLVKREDGQFETLLFTDNELGRARERVRKNPEDQLKPTLVDRLRAL
tara:strand:+ start:1693 stop:1953 length:261 start_codon:yes stop_codon:yes gene_type:complete